MQGVVVPEQLVSVIIPTRDRPEKLVQAIESVLAQTYGYYEIIVVDDGSIADTGKVLEKFSSGRFLFIRHESAAGACVARNTGLLHAKGDYIAFLDDDDRWMPQKLERQMGRFAEYRGDNLALVACGYYYESNGSIIETRFAEKPAEPFNELLIANWIGGTSLPLLKKSKLDEVGFFDPDFKSCQDWDLWIRLCQKFEVAVVEEPLVFRVMHPAQISGDLRRKIEGRKSLVEKYQRELAVRPSAMMAHLRRLGTLELLSGDVLSARGYYRHALQLAPTDVRSWVGLMVSRFPESARERILVTFALERIGDQTLYY
jgi:glycosyltransferase involved in cell wall biosynthesis